MAALFGLLGPPELQPTKTITVATRLAVIQGGFFLGKFSFLDLVSCPEIRGILPEVNWLFPTRESFTDYACFSPVGACKPAVAFALIGLGGAQR
jgi:hypothetical protein